MVAQTTDANKKGELYELKQDLKSDRKDRKKDALKRTIAHMTVGKDVSSLFTEVVNCIQTDNLELKKLVYLYLMNHAKSHPDLAILAVNSFVKDCEDGNPLIRALAVRTMGCIRVANISEYLCEPLRKCLRDDDPYVRKTAVVCITKLYASVPDLVEEQGFVAHLQSLLNDPNSMVISNCVAALSEIAMKAPKKNFFEMDSSMVNKLLTAVNECTEWGQCYILDSISHYAPVSETEAVNICERVTSRLSHSNSALVLSAIKVLIRMMDYISPNNALLPQLHKKMGPPLITMLSSEPEIQYVALRNIDLITQKHPNILKNEIKSFCVKYNDPIYIKLEKLAIIIKLVDDSNIHVILAELKEYASEVDVDFVRRSVRAIGRCALKVEKSADRCVSTLVDLIQTKVSYVVQESIVVMRDIMRKIPNQYESVIEKLCDNLESLNEPEARAAFIWIIGEYSHRINNAADILKMFVNGFFEENSSVQLQLLTATVKLFLKKPSENQEMVQEVLTMVTQQSDNPDIRDRGFIYWRLLSADPAAAREVVLAQKPKISAEADNIDENLLDELLSLMTTLASVYHKLPQTFVEGFQFLRHQNVPRSAKSAIQLSSAGSEAIFGVDSNLAENQPRNQINDDFNLLDLDFSGTSNAFNATSMEASIPRTPAKHDNLMDLLSDFSVDTKRPPSMPVDASGPSLLQNDLFSTVPGLNPPNSPSKYELWLSSVDGQGLEVSGCFSLSGESVWANLLLRNTSSTQLSNFIIQFNLNYFGLAVSSPVPFPASLSAGQCSSVVVPLQYTSNINAKTPINIIQVAVKTNANVSYFTVNFPINLFFVDQSNTTIDPKKFTSDWIGLAGNAEKSEDLQEITFTDAEIRCKLTDGNVNANTSSNPSTVYGYCLLKNGSSALFQISPNVFGTKELVVRSSYSDIVPSILYCLVQILKA